MFSEREILSLPEFAMAHGGWGTPVSNEDLIRRFPESQKAIEGTGFSTRYHSHESELGSFVDRKEHIREEMINVGASATTDVLRANNWQGAKVDRFIVTASTPPDRDRTWAGEIAKRSGIDPEVTQTYYLACAGWAVALLDVLKDPNLYGKKVVITSAEALGYLIDPDNAIDCATFGNGVASIAFRPGLTLEVLSGKTVILPDKKGVIRSPNCYNALDLESGALPEYYELHENSESVFVYGKNGVHLNLPVSKSGRHLEMDGVPTALFFKYAVPRVVVDVCSPYADQLSLCISHQPSAPVLRHTAREVKKKLPNLEVPWAKINTGNISSATTPSALGKLIKQGAVPPDKLFNITSYGVGSPITSMVVRLNSHSS